MLFGAFLVLGHFFFFRHINFLINTKYYHSNTKETSFEAMTGSSNGAAIFALQEMFNAVCARIVRWENHRYESDKINSYLLKTFVFEFFLSYTLLFYYALADPVVVDTTSSEKFKSLGVHFVTTVFTKNMGIISKMNLQPITDYKEKKQEFQKTWPEHRKSIKAQYVS